MPYADLGRPLARKSELSKGILNNRMRSASSFRAPPPNHPAIAKPIIGVKGLSLLSSQNSIPIPPEHIPANQSLDIADARSPCFQLSIGPIAINSNRGIIIGIKVALKNGGPTETFCPVVASKKSGYRVPRNTVAVATESRRLFITSPPSLLMG